MAQIEKMEREIERVGGELSYRKALIDSLIDPSTYEYTGTCVDTGVMGSYCACGHPIRFEFHIVSEKLGKSAIVGSTCIEHFAGVNPALFETLTKAWETKKAELLAAQKASAEALKQAEVQKLKAEFEGMVAEIRAKYTALRSRGVWADYQIFWWAQRTPRPAQYKRTSGYIRWYEKQIASLKAMLHPAPVQ